MDPNVSSDRIGAPSDKTYGAEVAPVGPVQDMFVIDILAGSFPPLERNASPAEFTGGTGGNGLGGMAEPFPPGGVEMDGTVYERRGF